jgi:predicted dehydrogenase
VRAIRNNISIKATGKQGLMVTQIMDALYRSSEENREVQID